MKTEKNTCMNVTYTCDSTYSILSSILLRVKLYLRHFVTNNVCAIDKPCVSGRGLEFSLQPIKILRYSNGYPTVSACKYILSYM